MYLPFRPRRGLSIPPGLPRINTAHPLASSLTTAIAFNGATVWDLCSTTGRGSLSFGSTATPTNGIVGQYLRLQNSVLTMQDTLSGDFSIVTMCMRNTTPPSSGPTGVAGLVSTIYLATAQRGIALDMGNSYGNVNKFYAYHYTSGGGFNAQAAWIDGVKQSSTSPCDVTITNGQWYGVSVVYTGTSGATGNLSFGGLSDAANYMEDGAIALFYVFKGVLPDAAMADLSVDPGQMLLWPDDDIFAAMGPAAAASVTATIAGSVDVTGSLTAANALAAQIAGTVGITGSLSATNALAATIAGQIDVTGTLTAWLEKTADIAGTVPITGQFIAMMEGGAGDTHDGILKRSRRERRIEAMRAKAEAERLADAQGLRLALEAALGMAAEIVEETTAPEVERAVEAAPGVATVDWRSLARDPAELERTRQTVADLVAVVTAARKRLADEDDEDALFLMGAA